MTLTKRKIKEIELFLRECDGDFSYIRQDCSFDSIAGFEPKTKNLIINPIKWNIIVAYKTKEEGIYWKNKLCPYKRAILLHEVGHLKTDCGQKESLSLKEFKAQKWAIEYAYQRKWDEILESLRGMVGLWRLYHWHSDRRIYKMAYKLIMSDRKWAKKYGLIV